MADYVPPKLYKLTSKQQIQEWQITVIDNVITTEFGLKHGSKQIANKVIKEGKNIGRSNETTANEQAIMEAKSDWEKKLAKDYFMSEASALEQKHRIAKEGGYLPMLAQDHKKHGKLHLKYPCIVQPKLDGIRCIATKFDGMVDLWFRSGKRILTLPGINEQLNSVMLDGEIFDGELYIHDEEFNEFTGAIRANRNLNEQITDRIQYWLYDCPRIHSYNEDTPFITRFAELAERITTAKEPLYNIRLTDTEYVDSEAEALEFYDKWVADSYEGMMFRNMTMKYEQKRSYDLLKYKVFDEEEFRIIDYVIDTRGTFGNMIDYKFVITTKDGIIVSPRVAGSQRVLAEMFADPESLIGQYATVKFFGYTPEGSLRFPVGKTVRFDK